MAPHRLRILSSPSVNVIFWPGPCPGVVIVHQFINENRLFFARLLLMLFASVSESAASSAPWPKLWVGRSTKCFGRSHLLEPPFLLSGPGRYPSLGVQGTGLALAALA